MTTYTITLSAAEDAALAYVTMSQQDWIDNAVHERARIAVEDIVKICVEQCLKTNIQIPGSKDAMVELAFDQGWVKTLEQIQQETQDTASQVL